MTKNTTENKPTSEVLETLALRDNLARGVILFGSACLAVGSAIGYAFGLLDGARKRKEGDGHEV